MQSASGVGFAPTLAGSLSPADADKLSAIIHLLESMQEKQEQDQQAIANIMKGAGWTANIGDQISEKREEQNLLKLHHAGKEAINRNESDFAHEKVIPNNEGIPIVSMEAPQLEREGVSENEEGRGTVSSASITGGSNGSSEGSTSKSTNTKGGLGAVLAMSKKKQERKQRDRHKRVALYRKAHDEVDIEQRQQEEENQQTGQKHEAQENRSEEVDKQKEENEEVREKEQIIRDDEASRESAKTEEREGEKEREREREREESERCERERREKEEIKEKEQKVIEEEEARKRKREEQEEKERREKQLELLEKEKRRARGMAAGPSAYEPNETEQIGPHYIHWLALFFLCSFFCALSVL